MIREELIKSDSWIVAHIECIVISKKPIRKIRKELTEFFIEYRNELLNFSNQKNKTK
mgnify:FL=1